MDHLCGAASSLKAVRKSTLHGFNSPSAIRPNKKLADSHLQGPGEASACSVGLQSEPRQSVIDDQELAAGFGNLRVAPHE